MIRSDNSSQHLGLVPHMPSAAEVTGNSGEQRPPGEEGGGGSQAELHQPNTPPRQAAFFLEPGPLEGRGKRWDPGITSSPPPGRQRRRTPLHVNKRAREQRQRGRQTKPGWEPGHGSAECSRLLSIQTLLDPVLQGNSGTPQSSKWRPPDGPNALTSSVPSTSWRLRHLSARSCCLGPTCPVFTQPSCFQDWGPCHFTLSNQVSVSRSVQPRKPNPIDCCTSFNPLFPKADPEMRLRCR